MRLCSTAVLASFLLTGAALLGTAHTLVAQTPASSPTIPPQISLPTTDHDPVRSPDGDMPAPASIEKMSGGYVLHKEVEEVVLNVTVLDGTRLVQDLTRDNFKIFEDGVQQKILSFQHTDLPVSIALVMDNSASMFRKRSSVNKSALDLIAASNPEDEAFVVNFSDEATLDQDFTSDVGKLREGLSHPESRGGTALYDAVVASADKLVAEAKHPKQVLILITDGEDNASDQGLEQTISRVQELAGPEIYTIGLLFGSETSKAEVKNARRALEMLSTETGGMAFFPKSIEQVDEIAAEVARDIRSQYTFGYHSTKPTSEPGFRRIQVNAGRKSDGKLVARTRTGYYPVGHVAQTNVPRQNLPKGTR